MRPQFFASNHGSFKKAIEKLVDGRERRNGDFFRHKNFFKEKT